MICVVKNRVKLGNFYKELFCLFVMVIDCGFKRGKDYYSDMKRSIVFVLLSLGGLFFLDSINGNVVGWGDASLLIGAILIFLGVVGLFAYVARRR